MARRALSLPADGPGGGHPDGRGDAADRARLIARPAALFWLFAGLHGVTWTLVPAFGLRNGLLDTIELVALGRTLEWGYWNHPPLAAWIAATAARAAGGGLWGVYLVGQLAVLGSLWACWRLARDVLPPWPAVLSVLALEGIRFYGYDTPAFNRNVVQLPLWALAVLLFWRALDSGRGRHWAGLGLVLGLGLLNKYDVALLVAVFAAVLAGHPAARRHLATPGPVLAALVAAVVWAPHLAWLVAHGFPPLDYALARATSGSRHGPLLGRLVQPAAFAGGQALVLLPAAALIGLLAGGVRRRTGPTPPRDAADGFLVAVVLGPFLAYLALAALGGLSLTLQWGAPLWTFAGLLLVRRLIPAPPAPVAVRRFVLGVAAAGLIGIGAFVGYQHLAPGLAGKASRGLFPGQPLAREITEAWARQHGGPLPIVAGDEWLAWNVSVYSPDRPVVYAYLDPRRSHWTGDAELRRRGGVILWRLHSLGPDLPGDWRRRFPDARVQAELHLPWHPPARQPPERIAWAIVPRLEPGAR